MKDSDLCLLYKNGFVETSEVPEFIKGFSNSAEFSRHFVNKSRYMNISYGSKYCLVYVIRNRQNTVSEAVGAEDIENSISKCNYMYTNFKHKFLDQENAF